MEARTVNKILTTHSKDPGKDIRAYENADAAPENGNGSNNLFANLLELAKASKNSRGDLYIKGADKGNKGNVQAESKAKKLNILDLKNNPRNYHNVEEESLKGSSNLASRLNDTEQIFGTGLSGLPGQNILTGKNHLAQNFNQDINHNSNQLNQHNQQNQHRNLISRFSKDAISKTLSNKLDIPLAFKTEDNSEAKAQGLHLSKGQGINVANKLNVDSVTKNLHQSRVDQNGLRVQVSQVGKLGQAGQTGQAGQFGQVGANESSQVELLSRYEPNRTGQSDKNLASHNLVMKYSDEQDLLNSNVVKNRSPFLLSNRPIVNSSSAVQTKNSDGLNKENSNPSMSEDQLNVLDFRSNAAHLSKVNNNLANLATTGGHNTTRIFNMNSVNSSNSDQIINKIIDYLKQSNLRHNPSLDLAVRHADLGQFRIHVNKMGIGASDKLNMEIVTNTSEGQTFFVKNEGQLSQGLLDSGIKIAQLKITPQAEFNRFGFDGEGKNTNTFDLEQSDRGRQFAGNGNNRGSEDSESRRRRELWENYKERYGT